MIPKSLILLSLLVGQIQAAPAPVETVYQTHVNVIRDDGSIFTVIENFLENYQATRTAGAVNGAAATAAAGSGSGSDFNSVLANNINRLLGYFGIDIGENEANSPAPAPVPATTALPATSSFDDSFPTFTFPSSVATAGPGSATNSAPAATFTPTTPTTSTVSTQSSNTGVSGSDPSFAAAILQSHNQFRAAHQAAALTWNNEAYEYAQNNANNYDCSGVLTHTHGKFGENLAAGFADGPSAVKAWYDEGNTYDYSSANTYNHFTQVVWKGSSSVGCAYKDCRAENWGLYVVCEYDPPGNVIGEEAANVLPSN